ncbi:MAG: tetratricopeptide repeat protein [Burkholderiales bacterium]|nr:tetratricopeptide repeat protein [Burkholderiales bacterium]
MATYDLEQQEQLDQVKHFWKKYGNLITWVLILVLGAYAAWTGYQYWQQKRSEGAGGLYEELDRAAGAGDIDKTAKAFADLKENYAGTTFTEQGALLAAKVEASREKLDQARATLQWLVENGKSKDLVAIARLRLAGLMMDAKQFDQASKLLDESMPEAYAPLVADRRGDILSAQGKKDDAIKAYQAAWKGLPTDVEYRRFVEGKLTALGQPPQPAKPAGAVVPSGMPAGLAPNN